METRPTSFWFSIYRCSDNNFLPIFHNVDGRQLQRVQTLQTLQTCTCMVLKFHIENMITVFPHIVSAETILFWIWPYVLWPLVTVHKCAETIQVQKLYEEIRYADLTPLIVGWVSKSPKLCLRNLWMVPFVSWNACHFLRTMPSDSIWFGFCQGSDQLINDPKQISNLHRNLSGP